MVFHASRELVQLGALLTPRSVGAAYFYVPRRCPTPILLEARGVVNNCSHFRPPPPAFPPPSPIQLRINFNITMLSLPCDYASVDVLDLLGTNKVNMTKNIVKVKLGMAYRLCDACHDTRGERM